ncbi:protein of unknown function [Candidatus Methylomirabilis oxygeniifera]|uniref:Uncharacterized protein n=1 Tax=Methylomirabilis oxygeniifera TaxID=671143 RepID=D5MF32_METO1|nr:protein of unknown function [Candidatus Methylomirabilis oxyfera]
MSRKNPRGPGPQSIQFRLTTLSEMNENPSFFHTALSTHINDSPKHTGSKEEVFDACLPPALPTADCVPLL